MIIAIDGNEANVEKKVGVSEFSFELISQFGILRLPDIEFEVYLKSRPIKQMPVESENFRYRSFGPKKAWTQWRLPLDLYIHKPRPNVFFTPSHYSPRISPVPTVVSVMDLSYIRFPQLFNKSDLFQLTNWSSYSVKNADAVITISNSSRSDIIKLYGKDENQVHVVYPGIKPLLDLEPHIYSMNELKNKYQISDKYILFVGTLQPRKNIKRLIEAFAGLVNSEFGQDKKIENLQLIIIGKKGWQYEEILQAPKVHGVESRVKFLDYVTDEDLPLFYKNAICMVWPSLYEGFGLPILEAMRYDCPVITSNISSMPEAGGNAALYVNPYDTDEIALNIKKLIQDNGLRKELINKGRKHITKFSWEKAAKQTLEVLKGVMKNER